MKNTTQPPLEGAIKPKKYKVLIFCNDCSFGQDPMGCFDGGQEYLVDDDDNIKLFDSEKEAEEAGSEVTTNVGPWDYKLKPVQGKGEV